MSRELESQFRILSVEDNPADVVLLQTAIDECAFHGNVRFCDSHEKAKSILLTESFDLLLSDLGTDREAAWSFIRSVRSMHPSLPIVILTGGSNPLPAYEAGAHAFIRKPSNWPEFLDKVRTLLCFWIEVAEIAPHPAATH